ncbi:MAG: hypothetical protein MJY54_01420 [archaeon]|nr:hypothetical protein [archaeon]
MIMSTIICPKCGCRFDTNEALAEHLRKVLSSTTVDSKHKRKKQIMSLVPAM